MEIKKGNYYTIKSHLSEDSRDVYVLYCFVFNTTKIGLRVIKEPRTWLNTSIKNRKIIFEDTYSFKKECEKGSFEWACMDFRTYKLLYK